MFVVDATVSLPHPPHVVLRVVTRLDTLPRWCAGLRRVRLAAPVRLAPEPGADGGADATPAGPPAAACAFSYEAADLRLRLAAHTPDREPGAPVRHVAEGDGVELSWTLATDAEPAGAGTRLHARIGVAVDPAHPTAAARAALCRLVARRTPLDLERLRVLVDRYEHGKGRAAVAAHP